MSNKSIFLRVNDHSVSGEEFELVPNLKYGFLETTPKPSLERLQDYYKSEDYISHTDSKRNLFEKAYHFVRTISLRNKLKLINSFQLEGKSILDIGCGTGDFLLKAKQNNWNVIGIEPNEQANTIANKKTNNLVFDEGQLFKLEPHSFDVITLWHVLEHLPNLEDYVTVLKKLLKQTGVLIIAVPNYQSYDAKYYKRFWAAYDAPRHLWHFSKTSLSNLINKDNMEVIKIKPMWFDSFYVSMLSEKYKTGKTNPLKALCIGLLSNIKALSTKEASSLIYIVKNK